MSDIPEKRAEAHAFHDMAKQSWQQQNLKWETENAFMNHYQLFQMMTKGRAKDLSEYPKTGGPAIIIGSGSSLDGVIGRLKDWKGAIICSTSHGTTLVYHDAPPTILTCLDPRVAPDPELDAPPMGWNKTVFVSHVSGPKHYYDRWFNQTFNMAYVCRLMEPTVPWYVKYLPWAYPWVKSTVLPFIDSVAGEVSIAARLGYDPLYTIGVDYGGPRFKQANWKNNEWYVSEPSGFVAGYKDLQGNPTEPKKGAGGLITDDGMVYSKRGLLISAFSRICDATNPVRIYQMSNPSNIVEFPFLPFDEVLENQGAAPPWTPEYRTKVAETIEITLAKSDTFMMPVDGGFGRDYRVFMMVQENIPHALCDIAFEIINNKAFLQKQERESGKLARELIAGGALTIESGELVIHGPERLQEFDTNAMHSIDIEATEERIRWLYEESRKLPQA
jgi:hypothetical protein